MSEQPESKIILTSSTPNVRIGTTAGPGKGKVHFSVGEEEMIKYFQKMGVTHLEAIDQCIKYKQEQVIYHQQQGTKLGDLMAKQIQKELGEEV